METNRTLSMMEYEDWRTIGEMADYIEQLGYASLAQMIRETDSNYERFKKPRFYLELDEYQ